MLGDLAASIWGLARAVRESTSEVRKLRASTNAATKALGATAASNDRLASAVEKLAEAPTDGRWVAEWNTGTPEPE